MNYKNEDVEEVSSSCANSFRFLQNKNIFGSPPFSLCVKCKLTNITIIHYDFGIGNFVQENLCENGLSPNF